MKLSLISVVEFPISNNNIINVANAAQRDEDEGNASERRSHKKRMLVTKKQSTNTFFNSPDKMNKFFCQE